MMQKKALKKYFFFPSLNCFSPPETDVKAFVWCLSLRWRENEVGSSRNSSLKYFQIAVDKD